MNLAIQWSKNTRYQELQKLATTSHYAPSRPARTGTSREGMPGRRSVFSHHLLVTNRSHALLSPRIRAADFAPASQRRGGVCLAVVRTRLYNAKRSTHISVYVSPFSSQFRRAVGIRRWPSH